MSEQEEHSAEQTEPADTGHIPPQIVTALNEARDYYEHEVPSQWQREEGWQKGEEQAVIAGNVRQALADHLHEVENPHTFIALFRLGISSGFLTEFVPYMEEETRDYAGALHRQLLEFIRAHPEHDGASRARRRSHNSHRHRA